MRKHKPNRDIFEIIRLPRIRHRRMRHVVLEVLLLSKGKAQKPIGKMGEMKLLGHRSMYPWFPSGMDMLGMISRKYKVGEGAYKQICTVWQDYRLTETRPTRRFVSLKEHRGLKFRLERSKRISLIHKKRGK